MPNYRTQIIELDNVGQPDKEIVLYCDDFYDLENLLVDPVGFLQSVGSTEFDASDWVMRGPVVAVIQPDDAYNNSIHGPLMMAMPSVHLSMLGNPSIMGSSGADGQPFASTNGAYIAQFAVGTHTLFIRYVLPPQPTAIPVEFGYTVPNIITSAVPTNPQVATGGDLQSFTVAASRWGTMHFDLNIDALTIIQNRAKFVVNHLIDPQANTYGKLMDTPHRTDVVRPVGPTRSVIAKVGPLDPVPNKYIAPKTVPHIVIVEGLSLPGGVTTGASGSVTGGTPGDANVVAVCTQSGCIWVTDPAVQPAGGYWTLNGIIVKNYVSPAG